MFFFNLFENDENNKLAPAMKEDFNKRIRAVWSEEHGEMLYSVVDVVGVLTEQPDLRHAAKYWSVLKGRLKKEGSELTTICSQLKLQSPGDRKFYKTDVATMEQVLRIIQSIPSPKAEPFKLWLDPFGFMFGFCGSAQWQLSRTNDRMLAS